MIEAAYFKHIASLKRAFGNSLEQTQKGAHVEKNTWLFASTYYWTELCRILLIDSEAGRTSRAREIRNEINNPAPSQIAKEFQQACFSDIPLSIIDATWKRAGLTMINIATPTLGLPPGDERKQQMQAIDQELLQLKTLWMRPPGNASTN